MTARPFSIRRTGEEVHAPWTVQIVRELNPFRRVVRSYHFSSWASAVAAVDDTLRASGRPRW